ncbi:MAG: family 10 glycosylhydrolase [Phormidesmis sp.]
MPTKKENSGGGCGSIPFSVILLFLGLGYWGFTRLDDINIKAYVLDNISTLAADLPGKDFFLSELPVPEPVGSLTASKPPTPTVSMQLPPIEMPAASPQPPDAPVTLPPAWEAKEIRGIYLSRYQATNNAGEQMIRDRVRYYKQQGINTIIHGVWGNGCTMYQSQVMQQTLGYSSCPNLFQDQWLDWLIDEAHSQGMQVHAYFEKGIKLDENSPIFDLATAKRWFVPGVDKTYPGVDHYLLDVENPEVAQYFTEISAEFVKRYDTIDAVQWDDYVGYHDELPGKVDRTAALTQFMKQIHAAVSQANPNVSFDLCHHNPYWGKRYFDADWQNWTIDRAFIQVYNDANFDVELDYVEQYQGIAISDTQFGRLDGLARNPNVKSVLLFPSVGKPEETAARFKQAVDQYK